jgi:hypothetical protein
MKRKLNFLLFVGSFCLFLSAQNETTKWYFGDKAGLDFMTNPPTILTNSAMKALAGTASIADATGNLLFYVKGDTVWNRLHQVMVNGSGLYGINSNFAQTCLIVKQPGSTGVYYIFTQLGGGFVPNTTVSGLHYSVIDMSLAAGMGSVTVKNTPLFTMPCKNALSGVRHCNGNDIWVLCHEAYNNSFRAYLVSSVGVSAIGVISGTGLVTNAPIGYIKCSPDGKRLAFINQSFGSVGCSVELFDFNNLTGVVSNSLILYSPNGEGINGCEFSPDGSKLYASSSSGFCRVYQWDLCAGSPAAIVASQYTLAVGQFTTIGKGHMQRAQNGKIYIAMITQSFLDVINNPNQAGAACNYVAAGQSIAPKLSFVGLPNFVSTQVKQVFQFAPGNVCASATFTSPVQVSLPGGGCSGSNNPVAGLLWSFGDPNSGTANTSTLSAPVHNYPGAGTYPVKLIINYGACSPDTLTQNIVITTPVPQTIMSSTLSCSTASAAVSVSGGSGNYSYSWSSGTANNATVSGLPPGFHTVTVTDNGNVCSVNKVFQIVSLPGPAVNVSGNFTICTGQTATYTAVGASSYTWSNASTSSVIALSPTITSTYSLTGSQPNFSCTTQKVFTVNVSKCTGIYEEEREAASVKIYPNPNNGLFFVETSESIKVMVYDALGKQIFETSVEIGKQSIDLGNLDNGLYFIKTKASENIRHFVVAKTY